MKSLENFWSKLGSKTKFMTFEDHDYVLSLTSHLPHAVAYSIVKTAIKNKDSKKLLEIFLSTKKVRKEIIEAGQDTDKPGFGRK